MIYSFYECFYLSMFILMTFSLFLFLRYQKDSIILIASLLLVFGSLQLNNVKQLPNKLQATVIEIKENYYIVKVTSSKVVLYSQETLNYGDKIRYEGIYSSIYTPASKSSFSFMKYNNRRNVYYQIKAVNIKIIKPSTNLLARLHTKINQHPNRNYLNKIILGINHSEINENLLMIIISYGVIIKSLINLIKSIANKFLYEKLIIIIEFSLYFAALLTFRQYEYYLSILIYQTLKLTKLERLDQICLSSLLVLFLFPSFMFSLSFIIINLYRIVSFISIRNLKITQNLLILIPVQLLYFYKVNILEIIFYPLLKLYGIILYLAAFVDVLCKSNLVNYFLKFNVFKSELLIFTGHMKLLYLGLWIIFGLLVLSSQKVKYQIALLVVLILNQYQLLLSPFFSYTQLYIGQGDCAILKYPFKNDVILIDSGPPSGYSKLASHLDYYGIKTIHAIIVSHADLDHNGNNESLVNDYNVLRIIENPGETMFYNLLINSVQFNYGNDNDDSLITYFSLNDYLYLSLGDISKAVEIDFINTYPQIKPNIIKLGHHGSDSSSAKELLTLDSIKLLLNSSGYNNMYQHPHKNVLSRISDYNLAFLDTQSVGDIEIRHFFQFNFITY